MTESANRGWTERAGGLLLMVAGPAALGACAGMQGGASSMMRQAVLVPSVLLGVAAMMIPALYIGAAFCGVAPSAQSVARAAGQSLEDAGKLGLGLSPALAFMVATSQDISTATVMGAMMIAAMTILGMRALFLRLFAGRERGHLSMPLFACWSLVSLGIGWRMMHVALEVNV